MDYQWFSQHAYHSQDAYDYKYNMVVLVSLHLIYTQQSLRYDKITLNSFEQNCKLTLCLFCYQFYNLDTLHIRWLVL